MKLEVDEKDLIVEDAIFVFVDSKSFIIGELFLEDNDEVILQINQDDISFDLITGFAENSYDWGWSIDTADNTSYDSSDIEELINSKIDGSKPFEIVVQIISRLVRASRKP